VNSTTKPKRVRIKAANDLKEVMSAYFADLGRAAENNREKVAWCTSVGPAELLRALGFHVHFPENHAAALGTVRTTNDYIPEAIAAGYSSEYSPICSYLTSDIGAFLKGETVLARHGLDSVPKPDVLVYHTNQCKDVREWFSFYAKRLNVPLLGITAPHGVGAVTDDHLDLQERQHEELIAPLEKISGNSYNQSEMKRVLNLSLQTSRLWEQVLRTASAKPSPLTFFDSCIHMAPAVVLRGESSANEYYGLLLEEMKERLNNGVGAVKEKLRIYWEGMPIWGKLRALSELFAEHETSVVASTYCNSWIFEGFSAYPSNPLRSMAKAYTEIFINRAETEKQDYLRTMAETFDVDGFIYHNAKTCPNNSNTSYGLPKRLKDEIGKPYLVIDADLNDLSYYAEAQVTNRIEAFIEQLPAK
jgi:benzoyl-CoA reductase/2-hydroxyglutaryl-CoA dehydratase subunit BcrC/BadD/HgdB